jgi:hypothetical protein
MLPYIPEHGKERNGKGGGAINAGPNTILTMVKSILNETIGKSQRYVRMHLWDDSMMREPWQKRKFS